MSLLARNIDVRSFFRSDVLRLNIGLDVLPSFQDLNSIAGLLVACTVVEKGQISLLVEVL
jgi:hypothetical protein